MTVGPNTTLIELQEWLRVAGACISVARTKKGLWIVTLFEVGEDPMDGIRKTRPNLFEAVGDAVLEYTRFY